MVDVQFLRRGDPFLVVLEEPATAAQRALRADLGASRASDRMTSLRVSQPSVGFSPVPVLLLAPAVAVPGAFFGFRDPRQGFEQRQALC